MQQSLCEHVHPIAECPPLDVTEPDGSELRNDPRRPKVLIIDDDPTVTGALSVGLSRLGYRTVTASDGTTGMKLVDSERPSLVLMDVGLPDADGMELCRRLADDPALAATPVIIVSGTERVDVVRESRAAGSHYFVRKPYDPNVLLVLIDRAIAEADATDLE